MKWKELKLKYKFLIIFLILILIIFVSPLKYYNPPLSGSGRDCKSIAESKELGVFVREYYIPGNEIVMPDSSILKLKEVWLEYSWVYGTFSSQHVKVIDDPIKFKYAAPYELVLSFYNNPSYHGSVQFSYPWRFQINDLNFSEGTMTENIMISLFQSKTNYRVKISEYSRNKLVKDSVGSFEIIAK